MHYEFNLVSTGVNVIIRLVLIVDDGGLVVAYESRLELALVMLADQARDVMAIAAQPFQLDGLVLQGPDEHSVREVG